MKRNTAWALALCVSMTGFAFAAEATADAKGDSAVNSVLGTQATVTQAGEGAPRSGRMMRNRPMGGAQLSALKQMTLTDEQKTKLEAISKDWEEGWKSVQREMLTMKQNGGTTGTIETRQAMAKKLMELNDDVNKRIDALLTDEQKAELKERMAKQQMMRTQRMGTDEATTKTE